MSLAYVIKPGDTFRSIATALTVSPANAVAISNANGIFDDVDTQGNPIPYDPDTSLAFLEGTTILIPDNLLKTGPGSRSVPPSWMIVLGLAVILGVSLLGKR